MPYKKIFIITGGPGFGKTEIITGLRRAGYTCSDEFARCLIEEQIAAGGSLLPWRDINAFQREILRRRIAFHESVPDETIAFADRGIIDQLIFAECGGFPKPEFLLEAAADYCYATKVFVTPPWREIFVCDDIRNESYEESVRIDSATRRIYTSMGYEIIDLPETPVDRRVNFILSIIA